jgi:hypothetical protein
MTMTPASALSFFASVIKSGEPWTPICQQAMDEAMAHMLRQANLTGGIPMTLPQNVKDAVKFANAECGKSSDFTFDMSGADWQTIRAHLMSQEAEISNLRDDRDSWLDQASQRLEDWDDMRRLAESAESRLASANALLREIMEFGEDRELHIRIQDYLTTSANG